MKHFSILSRIPLQLLLVTALVLSGFGQKLTLSPPAADRSFFDSPSVFPTALVDSHLHKTTADRLAGQGFSTDIYNYPGSVRVAVEQPDGKLLVGGYFKSINNQSHYNLLRLNADRSLDAAFNPLVSDTVFSIAVQSDGKILIGGAFIEVNGVPQRRLSRLNSDGTLDTSFQFQGADYPVYATSIQSDGKIVIAGSFRKIGTTVQPLYARLNADGSIDNSFAGFPTFDGFGLDLHILPDGKMLVGGFFVVGAFPFQSFHGIIRLNADGNIDSDFNLNGNGAPSTVNDVVVQPDGKIIIAGAFTSYGGTPRNRIARLNADGTLDPTFDPGSGANSSIVSAALTPAGKVLVSGLFTTFNGTSRIRIAQLNSDGSVDNTFDPGSGFNGAVYEVVHLSSGLYFAGGNVSLYNGNVREIAVVLAPTGSLDNQFGWLTKAQMALRSAAVQPDGKVIVAGSFNVVNGQNHNSIVRLNSDGSTDPAFIGGTGTNNTIYAVEDLPGGKTLIGGAFTTYNGAARSRIARLNSDGSLDPTFVATMNGTVAKILPLPDGKLLVGGQFTTVNGTIRVGIARLESNGTLDASFAPDREYGFIECIIVQADGKIVIGGDFSDEFLTGPQSLARLNPNGTLDATFANPLLPTSGVFSMAQQTDGKILIGGVFNSVGGVNRNGIARINPDGTLDPTFDFGTGTAATDDVEDIEVLSDGRILIVGAISTLNGTPRRNVALVAANGSVVDSFAPDAAGFVWDIEPSGGADEYFIVGDFTHLDGAEVSGIARLQFTAKPAARALFDFDGDGKTDVSVFRPSGGSGGGEWWYLRSSDGGNAAFAFGANTDTPVPADYTGDGKADIAFWRPATGEWYVIRSEDNTFFAFPFGSNGDVPMPADYDGDGKADQTVFRPSSNTWFTYRSSDSQVTTTPFGAAGDKPVAADYDGDGKADIAIYRPTGGTGGGEWWYLRSSDGANRAFAFGSATDKAVPADYTGDGKADLAFWRPSTGEWYVLRSEDSTFFAFPFGISTDIPVPGDYDGDGKADAAVFRPSQNTWYLLRSTAGFQAVAFGAAGDVPLPNSYVR